MTDLPISSQSVNAFVPGIFSQTAAFALPTLERLLFRPKRVPAIRVLVLTPARELAVQYVLFLSLVIVLKRYTYLSTFSPI